jgi:hypothetical protein
MGTIWDGILHVAKLRAMDITALVSCIIAVSSVGISLVTAKSKMALEVAKI